MRRSPSARIARRKQRANPDQAGKAGKGEYRSKEEFLSEGNLQKHVYGPALPCYSILYSKFKKEDAPC
jgi:hypothetical protein